MIIQSRKSFVFHNVFLICLPLALLWITSGAPAIGAETTKVKQYGVEKEGQALIYFIRDRRFPAAARTMFLFADQKHIGVLDNNCYTFAYLGPGKHLLWTNWIQTAKEMFFHGGATYYIDMTMSGTLLFNELSPKKGKELLEEVKFYATPNARETRKAQKHILKRYHKAVLRELAKEMEDPTESAYIAPEQTEGLVKIPSNQEVQLEFMENVSSHLTPTKQPFWMRVVEDVWVDGTLFVSKGTMVKGTVLEKTAAMAALGASMKMKISELSAVDGTLVPMGSVASSKGKNRRLTAGLTGAGLAVLFGEKVARSVTIKGRQAYIPAGRIITAWTRTAVWITPNNEPESIKKIVPSLVLPAKGPVRTKFHPGKRKDPKPLLFSIVTEKEIVSAEIIQVGDWTLPDPVTPYRLYPSVDGWTCLFLGWDLVKFISLEEKQNQTLLVLEGSLADGTPFRANLEIQIKRKGRKASRKGQE
ncbi:MAG: hypothetical protein QNK37_11705 [Acidobacteriota bacterium]|nr:hypothetical protein [Acidobacteriota bacterium]